MWKKDEIAVDSEGKPTALGLAIKACGEQKRVISYNQLTNEKRITDLSNANRFDEDDDSTID